MKRLRQGVHAQILRRLRAPRLPHHSEPSALGLDAQPLRLLTAGGKTLFAWFVPAPGAAPAPAVVVMHGWGANASFMLPAALPLHAAGFAVLLLDARCHGASDDEDFTSLPRFAEDIETGLDWLKQQSGVDSARLAIMGHSVGAGAALLCAARRTDVRAVVSLSAFAHPREVMLRFMAEAHIPYPLLGWYVLRHVQRVIGVRFDEIAPLTSMRRIGCPVLLVHGTDDKVVPFDDARRLQAAGLPGTVQRLSVAGGHDPSQAIEKHFPQLIDFLQRALATAAAPDKPALQVHGHLPGVIYASRGLLENQLPTLPRPPLNQHPDTMQTSTIQSFFDTDTSTVTHVVSDPATGRAAIIDSVLDYDPKSGRTSHASADKVIAYVEQAGLKVDWLLETHAHADHLSAAPYLQEKLGGKIAIGRHICKVQEVFKKIFNAEDMNTEGADFDHLFDDGETFKIGQIEVRVMHTPGHTPACLTYILGQDAFVGDTLFMPDYGSARCDFPGGDAAVLYRSIRNVLALAPDMRLHLCHDYPPDGRAPAWVSTVAEQRAGNIHVHDGVTEAQFVSLRTARDKTLSMPVLILPAVQVNVRAGKLPPPEDNGVRYLKIPVNLL